jgi:hypothetical protein
MSLPTSNRSQISKVIHGLLGDGIVYAVKATNGIRYSASDLESVAPEVRLIDDFEIDAHVWDTFEEIHLPAQEWSDFRCWTGIILIPLKAGPHTLHFQTFHRDVLAFRTALLQIDAGDANEPELLATRRHARQRMPGQVAVT